MAPAPFIPLGRVVKTHGLKGEVAVVPAADLPFVLPEGLEVWFVPPPRGVRTSHIQDVRRGPKGPLIKLEGVDDITTAARLVGAEILARSADLPPEWSEPPVEEDDPVGLAVSDEAHGALGEIVEVIFTGANDVWVVHGPLGEILLPVIDEVVLECDYDRGTALVRLLPGLLPDDGEEFA